LGVLPRMPARWRSERSVRNRSRSAERCATRPLSDEHAPRSSPRRPGHAASQGASPPARRVRSPVRRKVRRSTDCVYAATRHRNPHADLALACDESELEVDLTIKLNYPCCPYCGSRTAVGVHCVDCQPRPRQPQLRKPGPRQHPKKKRRIVKPERRVSVWTVSGGLPSLGKRRRKRVGNRRMTCTASNTSCSSLR
jgi:hypothetical protein